MVKMVSVSGGAVGTFSSAYGSPDLLGRSIEATQGRSMLGETVDRTQGRSQLQESLWETARSAGLPPRFTLDAMRLAALLRATSRVSPWLQVADVFLEGMFGWYKHEGPVAWDGYLPSGWCVAQSMPTCQPSVGPRKTSAPLQGWGKVIFKACPARVCTYDHYGHAFPIVFTADRFNDWQYRCGPRQDAPDLGWSGLTFGVPASSTLPARVPYVGPTVRTLAAPVPVPPRAVARERTYGPGRVFDRRRGYEVPATTVVVGPDGVHRGPPSHSVLPPAAGEKEDKFKFPMHTALQRAFGSLTELSDAINCMAKNISYKTKSGKQYFPCAHKARLQDRIACVLANLGGLDKKELAKCLVLNELQDQTIGRLASGANRHFFKSGYAPKSPHGLGFGGFSQRMR